MTMRSLFQNSCCSRPLSLLIPESEKVLNMKELTQDCSVIEKNASSSVQMLQVPRMSWSSILVTVEAKNNLMHALIFIQ